MKTLVTICAILFSTSAFAFTTVDIPNLQFPDKSEWAKGKVKRACGVQVAASDIGVTTKAQSSTGKTAFVYTVYSAEGEMIAQAAAYKDNVFTKATCQ